MNPVNKPAKSSKLLPDRRKYKGLSISEMPSRNINESEITNSINDIIASNNNNNNDDTTNNLSKNQSNFNKQDKQIKHDNLLTQRPNIKNKTNKETNSTNWSAKLRQIVKESSVNSSKILPQVFKEMPTLNYSLGYDVSGISRVNNKSIGLRNEIKNETNSNSYNLPNSNNSNNSMNNNNSAVAPSKKISNPIPKPYTKQNKDNKKNYILNYDYNKYIKHNNKNSIQKKRSVGLITSLIYNDANDNGVNDINDYNCEVKNKDKGIRSNNRHNTQNICENMIGSEELNESLNFINIIDSLSSIVSRTTNELDNYLNKDKEVELALVINENNENINSNSNNNDSFFEHNTLSEKSDRENKKKTLFSSINNAHFESTKSRDKILLLLKRNKKEEEDNDNLFASTKKNIENIKSLSERRLEKISSRFIACKDYFAEIIDILKRDNFSDKYDNHTNQLSSQSPNDNDYYKDYINNSKSNTNNNDNIYKSNQSNNSNKYNANKISNKLQTLSNNLNNIDVTNIDNFPNKSNINSITDTNTNNIILSNLLKNNSQISQFNLNFNFNINPKNNLQITNPIEFKIENKNNEVSLFSESFNERFKVNEEGTPKEVPIKNKQEVYEVSSSYTKLLQLNQSLKSLKSKRNEKGDDKSNVKDKDKDDDIIENNNICNNWNNNNNESIIEFNNNLFNQTLTSCYSIQTLQEDMESKINIPTSFIKGVKLIKENGKIIKINKKELPVKTNKKKSPRQIIKSIFLSQHDNLRSMDSELDLDMNDIFEEDSLNHANLFKEGLVCRNSNNSNIRTKKRTKSLVDYQLDPKK